MTVVDTMPPAYYEKEHIETAVNIPGFPYENAAEFTRTCAPDVLPDCDATIVVYCANVPCRNSELVGVELLNLGCTNVFKYREGIEDWVTAGLPTESSHWNRQLAPELLAPVPTVDLITDAARRHGLGVAGFARVLALDPGDDRPRAAGTGGHHQVFRLDGFHDGGITHTCPDFRRHSLPSRALKPFTVPAFHSGAEKRRSPWPFRHSHGMELQCRARTS